MKIGNWELRSPITHYVYVPIEQEVYDELRAHFGEKIAKEIKSAEFDLNTPLNTPIQVYEKAQIKFADIARGQK
jgi:hypothetical protein